MYTVAVVHKHQVGRAGGAVQRQAREVCHAGREARDAHGRPGGTIAGNHGGFGVAAAVLVRHEARR